MKKVCFSFENCVFQPNFQNFGVFWNGNFEKLGLEEITEIVDLVERFPLFLFSQCLFPSKTRYSNEYLVAKVGFDTGENESCEVCSLLLLRT